MKGTTVTVTADQFASVVKKALSEYGEEAFEVVSQCAKTEARASVKQLKGSAPSGGEYARGWTHKVKTNGRTIFSDTVHNRKYQLTHLLEKPHSTGGGKRIGHYPRHVNYTGEIAKVEAEHTQKLMEEVIAKL